MNVVIAALKSSTDKVIVYLMSSIQKSFPEYDLINREKYFNNYQIQNFQIKKSCSFFFVVLTVYQRFFFFVE